jgi:NitT/TauT family transport system substrate-binding protein
LIALLAALVIAGQAQAEKLKILFPIIAVDESYAPFLVARELGYFAQEGLDVEFVPTAGGNQGLLQMAAGNGDIACISPGNVIAGIQPAIGMKVMAFYNVYYKNIWSVSVLPDSPIKSLDQLKGKKIGVASMGSSAVLYGKAYLAKVGIEIGKDGTSYLPIGVGAQGATAIRSGNVDAAIYWDAMLAKLEVAGLKLRQLPVDEVVASLPDVTLSAQTDTIEKKPAMLIGVGRALAKGYVFNQANREAAVRITWKQYPESKPRNMSEEDALKNAMYVNEARMNIWEPRGGARFGEFLKSDYDNVIAFAKEYSIIPKTAEVPPDKLYTNKFVDEFNKFDVAAVKTQAASFDMSKLK